MPETNAKFKKFVPMLLDFGENRLQYRFFTLNFCYKKGILK
jgi:hypothetical protein